MKHSITQVISERILTWAVERIEKGNEKEKMLASLVARGIFLNGYVAGSNLFGFHQFSVRGTLDWRVVRKYPGEFVTCR